MSKHDHLTCPSKSIIITYMQQPIWEVVVAYQMYEARPLSYNKLWDHWDELMVSIEFCNMIMDWKFETTRFHHHAYRWIWSNLQLSYWRTVEGVLVAYSTKLTLQLSYWRTLEWVLVAYSTKLTLFNQKC